MKKRRFPRVRVYTAVEEAVERGLAFGWNRAHKHTDAPSEEQVKGAMLDAVMLELSERFHL